jgi:hypothetical protein
LQREVARLQQRALTSPAGRARRGDQAAERRNELSPRYFARSKTLEVSAFDLAVDQLEIALNGDVDQ